MSVIANLARLWVFPAILAVLVIAAAWVGVRWYYSEYLSSLAGVPLFATLESRRLRSVARAAARQEVPAGTRIITEGQPGDGFYVLEKGSATVTVRGERKATLGPGGYFGEMAVIDRGLRSGTVTTDALTTVLHLPSAAFRSLIQRDPALAAALEAELVRRLREAGRSLPAGVERSDGSIERLEALSHELRAVRHVDWGTGTEPRRWRWFGR